MILTEEKIREIIIVGYNGHSFVALDILEQTGYTIRGYCDTEQKQFNPYSLQYLGKEADVFKDSDLADSDFFVGIGNNVLREKVHCFLVLQKAQIINSVHPRSVISRTSRLGIGVLVAASATINPFCEIGSGVICNTSSTIDHECVVKDFAHICPGTVLCGNVSIGKNCFIGANSVVKQGVNICDNVVIGAGSTVVKDIVKPGTYFGNSLKSLR